VDFGSDLPIDVPNELFAFWDRYLKHIHDGVTNGNMVRVFRIESLSGQKNADGRLQAGGSWQELAAWPPPDAVPTSFYLTSERHLATRRPAAGSLSFTYDPNEPVPSVGGNVSSGGGVVLPGPYDQRCSPEHLACGGDTKPLNARPDVLSFETAPLEKDLDVTGMISVDLWVSSSAVDTDFTAKLIDQYPPTADYPDGYAMLLTDSVVRARLRSFTRAGDDFRRICAIRNTPLTPGQVYQVVIDLRGGSCASALKKSRYLVCRARLAVEQSASRGTFDAQIADGTCAASRGRRPGGRSRSRPRGRCRLCAAAAWPGRAGKRSERMQSAAPLL
jgi:putative CocE/NonD family hydrolase